MKPKYKNQQNINQFKFQGQTKKYKSNKNLPKKKKKSNQYNN